jgi:alpha-L-rhamnosidase
LIKTEWTKTTSSFNLQVQIPANSTAVVYMPAKPGQTVLLNGKKATAVYANGRAVVKIGSGNYQFSVANN